MKEKTGCAIIVQKFYLLPQALCEQFACLHNESLRFIKTPCVLQVCIHEVIVAHTYYCDKVYKHESKCVVPGFIAKGIGSGRG